MNASVDNEPLVLRVWAKPGASKTAVLGWRRGANTVAELVVAVAAPPEDGKANAAIGKCVAQWLGLPKRSISLTSGHTHRQKHWTIDIPSNFISEQRAALGEKLTPGF
jgi:uncharacterized protein YggU (UPF0235/DUF167 family)